MVSGPLVVQTSRSCTPPLSSTTINTIPAASAPSTPIVDVRAPVLMTIQSAPTTPTVSNNRVLSHNHHNNEAFEIDDAYECEIVNTLVSLLLRHGPLTLGKIGSMLHNHLNNHHLPAALKRQYGGLQKFVRKHRNQFLIGDDHPYNPHLHLITAKNFVQPLQPSIVPSPSGNNNTTNTTNTTTVPIVTKTATTTSPLTMAAASNNQLFMVPHLSAMPLIDPVFYNNYLQYSMQFMDYPFVPVNYFMDGANNIFPLH